MQTPPWQNGGDNQGQQQQQQQAQMQLWRQLELLQSHVQQHNRPSPAFFLVNLYTKAVASAVTTKDDPILEGFEGRRVNNAPYRHDARKLSHEDWKTFDDWLAFHRGKTVTPAVRFFFLAVLGGGVSSSSLGPIYRLESSHQRTA